MSQNKNVLITGATGGLGASIALEYAKNGFNLFLTGRNAKRLAFLCEKLKFEHPGILVDVEICDLKIEEEVYNMIDKVREKYGQIDILVNCAGVFPVMSLPDTDLQQYKDCISVNLTAPFILMKEFSKEMTKKRWGRIINIASSSAYAGGARTSVYCASKHALLGLSRSLFKELKNYNIRVLCVSPGSIKTNMGVAVEQLGQDYDTFLEPQEIAKIIVSNSLLDGNLVSEEIRLNRMFVQ